MDVSSRPPRPRRAAWPALALLAPLAGAQPVSWTPVGNIPGGTVTSLVHHSGNDAFFAGTSWQNSYNSFFTAGAVFRSVDHGQTWTNVSSDITAGSPSFNRVRSLAVAPDGALFAGLDGGGVFRSLDGGDHWTRVDNGLVNLRIRAVGVDAAGIVYAATDTSGVYVSATAGGAWMPDNTGLTSLRTHTLAFGPGFALVGTADAGVFKRVGAGTWMPAGTGLEGHHANTLFRASGGSLFALTDNGIYRSNDDAASWSTVAGPFSGAMTISMAESGTTLFVGARDGIFRSTDDGVNWTPADTGFGGLRASCLAADDAGAVVGGSINAGVYRWTDAAQEWLDANLGLYAHTIHRLVAARDGTLVAGTFANGIYRSTDGGQTWQPPPPELAGRFIFQLRESPWGELYAGNYTIVEGVSDGHAWHSTDRGTTWTTLDAGLRGAAMVSGFQFGAVGEVWMTAAWNPGGVSYSSTFGDPWTRIGPPQNIPAYCLARGPDGTLVFGSEGLGVWRLVPGGQWEDLGLHQSQQFAIGFTSDGALFVGNHRTAAGLYRALSPEQPLTAAPGFPGTEAYSILVLPNDDIYVSTVVHGVQRSRDRGETWESVSAGLPFMSSFCLTAGPGGFVYAAVPGAGVYRTAEPMVCVLEADRDGDADVDLSDLAVLLADFGCTAGLGACPGDIDLDGDADLGDLAWLLTQFGRTCP